MINHGYKPQSKLWKLYRSNLRGIIPPATRDCSTYQFCRIAAQTELEFHNKGFTLTELLIAMFVGILIMAAVYGAVNMAQNSSSSIEKRVIAQQDVRGALDLMALEIRMASYNKSLNNIWITPACGGPSANQNYKGIQAASRDSITIEMDIDNNGIGSGAIGDGPNEVITYAYDAANLRITRSTNCGLPTSFIGDTVASGRPRIVHVINNDATVNVPLFRYFNFNNVEIPPAILLTPAGIPNIRTIEISLAVETADPDPTIKARRRLIYSTRVIPRNHGINVSN
jgi:prepilin-type N-terminal cleavage/methylation domain-containing protein